MDIDATFKTIRSVYQAVTSKGDGDVNLTYKSKDYGNTTPWHGRVGIYEAHNESYDGALYQLLNLLKEELSKKVKSAETEADRLRQALNQLGN